MSLQLQDAQLLLPPRVPASEAGREHQRWKVGKLTFRADFDSGNLECAKQGTASSDVQLWTLRDCQGTENERGTRSWFYYGVSGHAVGEVINMCIMNLNRQGKLYSQDYKPWFWQPPMTDWQPLSGKVTYRRDGDDFLLRFTHRPDSTEEMFFAFAIPFSYSDTQALLERLDSLHQGLDHIPPDCFITPPNTCTPPHSSGDSSVKPDSSGRSGQDPVACKAAVTTTAAEPAETGAAAAATTAPAAAATAVAVVTTAAQIAAAAGTAPPCAPHASPRHGGGSSSVHHASASHHHIKNSSGGISGGSRRLREMYSRLYYRRDLLARSLEGRRVDVITITDCYGATHEPPAARFWAEDEASILPSDASRKSSLPQINTSPTSAAAGGGRPLSLRAAAAAAASDEDDGSSCSGSSDDGGSSRGCSRSRESCNSGSQVNGFDEGSSINDNRGGGERKSGNLDSLSRTSNGSSRSQRHAGQSRRSRRGSILQALEATAASAAVDSDVAVAGGEAGGGAVAGCSTEGASTVQHGGSVLHGQAGTAAGLALDGEPALHEMKLAAVAKAATATTSSAFPGKKVFFVSSRVHPGETPASHMYNGLLAFLLRQDDPRAAAARRLFVFHLVPLVNPDGVYHGYYRTDTLGQNLNRYYLGDPNPELQPSVFAIKSLLMGCAAAGSLEFYFDLHAHANKKGVFTYGNALEGEAQLQSLMYSKLVAMNNPVYDFYTCNYTERNMTRTEKDGSSKEGAGRVALFRETGLTHLYTIEANYNTCRMLGAVAPAVAALPPTPLPGTSPEDHPGSISNGATTHPCSGTSSLHSGSSSNGPSGGHNANISNGWTGHAQHTGIGGVGGGCNGPGGGSSSCSGNAAEGRASPPPAGRRLPPKFTAAVLQGVGRAFAIAALDLKGCNPWSRIPGSEHRSLSGVRSWLLSSLAAPADARNATLPPMSEVSVGSTKALYAAAVQQRGFARRHSMPCSPNGNGVSSSDPSITIYMPMRRASPQGSSNSSTPATAGGGGGYRMPGGSPVVSALPPYSPSAASHARGSSGCSSGSEASSNYHHHQQQNHHAQNSSSQPYGPNSFNQSFSPASHVTSAGSGGGAVQAINGRRGAAAPSRGAARAAIATGGLEFLRSVAPPPPLSPRQMCLPSISLQTNQPSYPFLPQQHYPMLFHSPQPSGLHSSLASNGGNGLPPRSVSLPTRRRAPRPAPPQSSAMASYPGDAKVGSSTNGPAEAAVQAGVYADNGGAQGHGHGHSGGSSSGGHYTMHGGAVLGSVVHTGTPRRGDYPADCSGASDRTSGYESSRNVPTEHHSHIYGHQHGGPGGDSRSVRGGGDSSMCDGFAGAAGHPGNGSNTTNAGYSQARSGAHRGSSGTSGMLHGGYRRSESGLSLDLEALAHNHQHNDSPASPHRAAPDHARYASRGSATNPAAAGTAGPNSSSHANPGGHFVPGGDGPLSPGVHGSGSGPGSNRSNGHPQPFEARVRLPQPLMTPTVQGSSSGALSPRVNGGELVAGEALPSPRTTALLGGHSHSSPFGAALPGSHILSATRTPQHGISGSGGGAGGGGASPRSRAVYAPPATPPTAAGRSASGGLHLNIGGLNLDECHVLPQRAFVDPSTLSAASSGGGSSGATVVLPVSSRTPPTFKVFGSLPPAKGSRRTTAAPSAAIMARQPD